MDADRQAVEVRDHLAHDPLDLVGQRATVGVAQDQAGGVVGRCGLEHPERVLRIRLVAVEEVLGVEEHPEPGVVEEPHRVRHHGDALVECRLQGFGHMEVPALADDARRAGTGVDQRPQRRVVVGPTERSTGRTERDELGPRQVELLGGATEELLVLRVRLGVSALDPVDSQPVELLGDAQLVLDAERDALELGTVAQGGVEDVDRLGGARYGADVGQICHDTNSTQSL